MNRIEKIITLLILTFSFSVSAQDTTYFKDNERLFVLGERTFEEPIQIVSPISIVIEKKYIEKFVNETDSFYSKLGYYEPESFFLIYPIFYETLIKEYLIPQTSGRIVNNLLNYYGINSEWRTSYRGFYEDKIQKYKNLTYINISCRDFVVVLVPNGLLYINNKNCDMDPIPVCHEPIWGLYRKAIIPIFQKQ